jgi:hypothetical protein
VVVVVGVLSAVFVYLPWLLAIGSTTLGLARLPTSPTTRCMLFTTSGQGLTPVTDVELALVF